jgi:hypothetical protein
MQRGPVKRLEGGIEGKIKEWKTPVVRTRTDLSKCCGRKKEANIMF